jgi:hypothetical protein
LCVTFLSAAQFVGNLGPPCNKIIKFSSQENFKIYVTLQSKLIDLLWESPTLSPQATLCHWNGFWVLERILKYLQFLCWLMITKYEGQSNENGSPRITLTVRKLVTLGFA